MRDHGWAKFFVYVCIISAMIMMPFAYADDPPALPAKLPPDMALIQKNGVLRVAIFNQNMPPFFMHDNKNNWSGIDVELAQMIAKMLSVKLVIVPASSYDNVIDLVFTGKADMGMGLLNISPQRELRISFTNSYYAFHPHMLVNRLQAVKNNWSSNPNKDMVQSMQANPKPFVVGVLEGGVSAALVHEVVPQAQIVAYPTVAAAMDDVVKGKISAAMASSPVEARVYLQNNPQAALLAEDVKITERVQLIAIAVPWQYMYFKDWLNIYFDFLETSGLEESLFKKGFIILTFPATDKVL